MEHNDDEIKYNDLSNVKPKNRLLVPIIALIFTFTPTLLMLLAYVPFIGIIFVYLLLLSVWGAIFHVIGIIISLIYIFSRIFSIPLYDGEDMQINIKGLIIAIISILAPIVRWSIIYYLYQKGSIELII